MASKNNSSKNSGKNNSTSRKTNRRANGKTAGKNNMRGDSNGTIGNSLNSSIRDEIKIWGTLAACLLLLVSHFGFGGVIGNTVSKIMFGILGVFAYIMPILLFVGVAFLITNKGNASAYIKMTAAFILCLIFCMLAELIMNGYDSSTNVLEYYVQSCENKSGGGLLGGIFVGLLCIAIGKVGTYLVALILAVICIVIITEKSLLNGMKKGGKKAYDSAKEDMQRRIEEKNQKKASNQENPSEKKNELEEQLALPDKQTYRRGKLRRKDKVVSGVTYNTTLEKQGKKSPDMREILDFKEAEEEPLRPEDVLVTREEPSGQLVINRANPLPEEREEKIMSEKTESEKIGSEKIGSEKTELEKAELEKTELSDERDAENHKNGSGKNKIDKKQVELETANVEKQIQKSEKKPKKEYKFPPLSLLKRGKLSAGDSDEQLRQTAAKLEETLASFGVGVKVTNISCGPTVTRYELQPELGVKVSSIVGRANDIKLNLAASNIRIEAPIPGKAAVGIEVPNKSISAVMLRDLLETEQFRNHRSKIVFAAGRDISGYAVVSNIADMPHALIAGSTGSGKSVCINTIIMSILYKASPDDVRLILIDPKVVELAIYNGIPHLMIPVVTDPKKAAGALNWAVAEMTRRYQVFAENNVRDISGYNRKAEANTWMDETSEDFLQKMPQIVIIVDELADLMMVAPGDVEESICRLAQLARAAGIHLIVATQRPSVNVITGLIKANMPTRIAFAVSSGVDSRTILDRTGAEKLLGKGDMLFHFQGQPEPIRMQGALVTDKEIQAVVEYLTNHGNGAEYDETITSHMNGSPGVGREESDKKDVYFVDAGRCIIEKDKASIGMLQRVFKIGFNRAARIMDQLCEAGIVGEEEGTKPRRILMTMEQFERYVEENL